MENLKLIAKQMVSSGKGILAADESTPTCTKRFNNLGIESTENNRNEYRSSLFSTEELEKFISGVILFDETFFQTLHQGVEKIPDYLQRKNILTGIKVDTGAKPFANHHSEKITEGLDNLRDRLTLYKSHGANFAKWRAVITIGDKIPTKACIYSNAHALARYASLCQENEIVPIVEPEVLMDGTHTIQTCYEVTNMALDAVFEALDLLNVDLEGIVLKPNMVLPGTNSNQEVSDEEIIDLTFNVLNKNVPELVPGIAFLSGGQSSDLAAKRLNMLNSKYNNRKPWQLTFSYGRALQEDALLSFSNLKKGTAKEIDVQNALLKRAKMNHLASTGSM